MSQETPDKRRGLFNLWIFDKLIALPFIVLTTIIISLVLNIMIEWVGMALDWWTPPGAAHARMMLIQELRWLNQDFRHALGDPVNLARAFAKTLHGWLFVWNGHNYASAYQGSAETGLIGYLSAAVSQTQLFAVRIAILILSMPVFFLFGLVALVAGLTQRSLRRWGGAHEQGFIYHHAKRTLAPALIAPVVIYLSSPWSLHPNWVVLPFASICASGIYVTATTFKQYL